MEGITLTEAEAREATQVTGGFIFRPRPEYAQERERYES